jgi:hypothetical protein
MLVARYPLAACSVRCMNTVLQQMHLYCPSSNNGMSVGAGPQTRRRNTIYDGIIRSIRRRRPKVCPRFSLTATSPVWSRLPTKKYILSTVQMTVYKMALNGGARKGANTIRLHGHQNHIQTVRLIQQKYHHNQTNYQHSPDPSPAVSPWDIRIKI